MVDSSEKMKVFSTIQEGTSDIVLLINQGIPFFDWENKQELDCQLLQYYRIFGAVGKYENQQYAAEEHWLPESWDINLIHDETQKRLKTLNLLNSLNFPSALRYHAVLIDEINEDDGRHTVVCFISDAPDNTLEGMINNKQFLKFSEMIMLLYDVCDQLTTYKEHNIHHLEISPNSIVYKQNDEGHKVYSLAHWDIKRFIDAKFIPKSFDNYKAPDAFVEHDQDDLEKLDVYALVFSALEAFGIPLEDLDRIRSGFTKETPFPLEPPTGDTNSLVGYTTYLLLNCLLPATSQRSSAHDLMDAIVNLETFLPTLDKFTPIKLLSVLTSTEPVKPYYKNFRRDPGQVTSPMMFSPTNQSQPELLTKSEIKFPQEKKIEGGSPDQVQTYNLAQRNIDVSPPRSEENTSKKVASREGTSPNPYQDNVQDPEAFHEDIDVEIEPDPVHSGTKQQNIASGSPGGRSAGIKSAGKYKEIQLEASDPGNLIAIRNLGNQEKSDNPAGKYEVSGDPTNPKGKNSDTFGKKKAYEPPTARSLIFNLLSGLHCILLVWLMISVLLAGIIIRAGNAEAFRSQAAIVNGGLLGIGYLYQKNPIVNVTIVSNGTSCPVGTEESIGMWPGVQMFCYNPDADELTLGICPIDVCLLDCQQYQQGLSANFTDWKGYTFCTTRASYVITNPCPSGYMKCSNSFCVASNTCPLTTLSITSTKPSTSKTTTSIKLPDGRYFNSLSGTTPANYIADFNLSINQQRCVADHTEANDTRYPGLNVVDGDCGTYNVSTNYVQIDPTAVSQLNLFQNQSWWSQVSVLPDIQNYLTNTMELVQVNYYNMSSECNTFNTTQFLTIQNNFQDFYNRLTASCWAIIFWIATFDLAIVLLLIRDCYEKSKVTLFADPKQSEEDRYMRIGVMMVIWMLIIVITASAGLGSIDNSKAQLEDINTNQIQLSGACFTDSQPRAVLSSLSDLVNGQLSSARNGFLFVLIAVLVSFVPMLLIHITRKFYRGFKILKEDVKNLLKEGDTAAAAH